MVAEAGGNMAWMEDQVGFCVCEKELCLSGTVAGFFERELSPHGWVGKFLFVVIVYRFLPLEVCLVNLSTEDPEPIPNHSFNPHHNHSSLSRSLPSSFGKGYKINNRSERLFV